MNAINFRKHDLVEVTTDNGTTAYGTVVRIDPTTDNVLVLIDGERRPRWFVGSAVQDGLHMNV